MAFDITQQHQPQTVPATTDTVTIIQNVDLTVYTHPFQNSTTVTITNPTNKIKILEVLAGPIHNEYEVLKESQYTIYYSLDFKTVRIILIVPYRGLIKYTTY